MRRKAPVGKLYREVGTQRRSCPAVPKALPAWVRRTSLVGSIERAAAGGQCEPQRRDDHVARHSAEGHDRGIAGNGEQRWRAYDKAGVTSRALSFSLPKAYGVPAETVPGVSFGNWQGATVAGAEASGTDGNQQRSAVLIRNRDTVFPRGEPERKFFRMEGERAYGSVVCDVRTGLVMNIFVLAAFRKFGCASSPPVGLFTRDEEVGTPEGRALIASEVCCAQAIFNSYRGHRGDHRRV